MEKLLIICGPTATGKTSLALHLAEVLDGELVSADSRQVYKGLDIGTGKDIPQGAKWHIAEFSIFNFQFSIGYWETKNQTRIWGYDLVEPTENFSVGQYIKITRKIINNIWSRDKLPILVGGTGLYIKGVVDGISTASIPKNIKLREILEGKKPSELFKILAQFDPGKAASMNISDRKNPRRLVRAIEIADTKVMGRARVRNKKKPLTDEKLFIGLRAEKKLLDEKIENRVNQRVNQGIEDEIRKLFTKGVTWRHQAMSSLGYKQWQGYFEKLEDFEGKKRITEGLDKKLVREKWKQAEKQYVKRQLVWFKKDKRITWFDIAKKDWQKNVEKLVKKWYSSNNNGKANKN